MSYKPPTFEPIAVVGSACRFPGKSSSPAKLWELLREPHDLSKRVPLTRFNITGFYNPDGEYHGTTNAPKSYWLEEDHRTFDAQFFNITPKEAEAIDPQQKILLEVCYEAVESAGLSMSKLSGSKVSCYVGTMTADFDGMTQRDELTSSQYCATGTSRAIISNRISYFFNWNGPSMTIDTACSSSLVAVHQAVLSLRNNESTVACVAGANVMISPENFIAEASLHMLSPTGKSRMWDEGADGYARGEGIAAVMLKTLSQALRDGDHIEGIIRESGVNSDGRTQGITMPSSVAQAALITDTYRRSGLDPRDSLDRCQYFEAHGTGTQAGDPREAGAIYRAFFGTPEDQLDNDLGQTMLVGSIKTVIGHTEGAAGLAGLIKCLQSLHHQIIPPNQHLVKINPAVEPFTRHLRVPTKLTPWPSVSKGHPLRASVNSFGFGGTNAHVILERYEPTIHLPVAGVDASYHRSEQSMDSGSNFSLPLLLSANSEASLSMMVRDFAKYLQKSNASDVRNLAWTMAQRRTLFPHRVAFCGASLAALQNSVQAKIQPANADQQSDVGVRYKVRGSQPRILGIFTGQGAQWPQMAACLISTSPQFHTILSKLDRVLQNCPDPPSWSLITELKAPASTSRVHQAEISQPACTAIQIALVDVLAAVGVTFSGVVGHSSGEIGAAYAAGILSAESAILIAYYRGFHAKLAGGGEQGSMLAAGLDVDSAIDLCEQPTLKGRLCVAASNSPAGVTLSGDKDAVEEAKSILDAKKTFARQLKVDTAYHSHHMDPCAAPYLASLAKLDIAINDPSEVSWTSSVYGPAGTPSKEELKGRYFRDNMVQAVLFSEALQRALQENGPFDVAVEVGPHPALKGPAIQTMQEAIGSAMPYTGVLSRGKDDTEAFKDCLGFLWTYLGSAAVKFDRFDHLFAAAELPYHVVKGLPSYPWDHSKIYLRQSRLARQYLQKSDLPHELLGIRTPDDSEHEMRWRNVLKPVDLPWLKHHRFQGQIIVPAAAYCIMALDAGRVLASSAGPLRMVELEDLHITSGISIEDDSQGAEVMFTLKPDSEIVQSDGSKILEAAFLITSVAVDGSLGVKKAVDGRIKITTGRPSVACLPMRPAAPAGMHPVKIQKFYDQMEQIGLGYSGPFRALLAIERKSDVSSAVMMRHSPEDTSQLAVRPALLDVCFQAAFAAFAAPGDGALWTSFLPQSIRKLRFNLAICDANSAPDASQLGIDAYVTEFQPTTVHRQASFTGDIEVFNLQDQMLIQIEGITVASFAASTEAEDRELYLRTKWLNDPVSGFIVTKDTFAKDALPTLVDSLISLYVPDGWGVDPPGSGEARSSQPRNVSPAMQQTINQLAVTSPHQHTLGLIRSFGENMPSMLPSLRQELIQEAYRQARCSQLTSNVMHQISHRFPRTNILEVAGESTVLPGIMHGLAGAFSKYEFATAGISVPEYFESLSSRLKGNLSTRVVDPGQDLCQQGFENQPFDIIILSHCIHRFKSSEKLLADARELIKPGGFLVVLQSIEAQLHHKLARSFYSADLSSVQSALCDVSQIIDSTWSHRALDVDGPSSEFSIDVFQAVDPVMQSLLNPLNHIEQSRITGSVVLIGGCSPETQRITERVEGVLKPFDCAIHTYLSLEDVDLDVASTASAVLITSDLDEPILQHMNSNTLKALQLLFNPHRYILWLVRDFREGQPWHFASVGMGRSLKAETPQLDLQFLDLDCQPGVEDRVVEALLRLAITHNNSIENTHLWTTEHELVIREKDLLIPRIVPLLAQNDRLNSIRRVIHREVADRETALQLANTPNQGHHRFSLEPASSVAVVPKNTADSVTIAVQYSTSAAIVIKGSTRLFLVAGTKIEDGTRVLALSLTNCSRINASKDWVIPAPASGDMVKQLYLFTMYLMASRIEELAAERLIALNDAPEALLLVLAASAKVRKSNIAVLSASKTNSIPELQHIHIHPQSAVRVVQAAMPNAQIFVLDFSGGQSAVSPIIEASAHPGSVFLQTDCLYQSCAMATASTADLAQTLRSLTTQARKCHIIHRLSKMDNLFTTITDLVAVDHVAGIRIVDWTDLQRLRQVQQPLDPKTLFSSTKTYILIGLTGELGQSLAKMMVVNGARHLVVASRKPPKQAQWRDDLEAMGADVRIEAVDATDTEAVTGLRDVLAHTMPPVGGILNGAMILADGLFADMSIENYWKVLHPKASGSKVLDEVFSDAALDFFVMFSSLTAVAGNRGQSNYAAANMYMAGLAAQRRKRGLAASVLDIGMLYGIGYINRTEGEMIYSNLAKQGYRPISEKDMHHMLTEAIFAGRAHSGQESELITGLQRFSLTDSNPLHWHFNPRFSHHTIALEQNSSSDTAASADVGDLLKNKSTEADISQILQQTFAAQLEIMLRAGKGTIKIDLPIIDLGVDSLVAVEVRSWFLKNTGKDMPVLKVLGGASVSDLCDDVAKQIYLDRSAAPGSERDVGLPSSSSSSSDGYTKSGSELSSSASQTDYEDEDDEIEIVDTTTETVPMSFGQARLWFPYIYLSDKTAYNCTTTYRLRGLLDIGRFERAISAVIRRHQVFRSSFSTDTETGQGMQIVSKTSPFKLQITNAADETADVEAEIAKVAGHKYDLEHGDTFIATLVQHSDERHTIIYGYHHIIIDAVSWQIFLQEVESCYAGEAYKLSPPSHYTDFSLSQRILLNSDTTQSKRDHFRREFKSLPPILPLFPFAKVSARKALTRYRVHDQTLILDNALVADVKRTASTLKSTTFHVYLTVLQILLQKFTGIDDICVGITDANRTDPTFMSTVGFLLDSLPVRFSMEESTKFGQMVANTRDKVYQALGSSGVPLDAIIEDVKATSSGNELPLFQILVNYRMGALKQKSMGDLQLDFVAYEDARHPFDFILSIDEDEGAGGLTLSAQAYLYDKAGSDLFLQTFVHLLKTFTADLNQSISSCQIFSKEQRLDVGSPIADNRIEDDWPATLSMRVDEMSRKFAKDVAIVDYSGAPTTFEQLMQKVNICARQLKATGARSGSVIALFCDPSVDAVAGLLAILRIGATYVPLDVRGSDERLKVIVEESAATCILCHEATLQRSSIFDDIQISKVNLSLHYDEGPAGMLPNESDGPATAFIMFTSGSTGKPKGIALTHTNFLTHVKAASKRMSLGRERVLQQSAYGYDASLAQIFYALANGGSIYLSSNRGEMTELTAFMDHHRITLTLCAPSEYHVMFQFGNESLRACSAWRIAMCGGEAFPPHLQADFRELQISGLEVYNAYGPTEVSVASNIGKVAYTLYEDGDDSKVSAGTSMLGYTTYILDEQARLCPPSWPGEICVAGPAVSTQGYLGLHELNEAKFIHVDVPSLDGTSKERLYRTGDRGRIMFDGSLECFGRIDGDSQIKLRGIRIELDDVASAITRASEGVIVHSVVILREEKQQYLVAYVTFATGRTPSDTQAYLRQLIAGLPLPQYMRPALAIPLAHMPTNASGKLDRRHLQNLPVVLNVKGARTTEITKPVSEVEAKLRNIWTTLLPIAGSDVLQDSNFFDLGGNSLLLLKLQAEIKKAFGIKIELSDLFKVPTINNLVNQLQEVAQDATHIIQKSALRQGSIDWVAETALDANLLAPVLTAKHNGSRSRSTNRKALTIALTGSTGFLGRSLLRELVRDPDVARIHCLAVRNMPLIQAFENQAPSWQKVVWHSGDLTRPNLGLFEEEARLIFHDVDVIIHNGADVSFLKDYQTLRSPNVDSTKNLVALTAHRRVPIHFISTAGVAHLSGRDTFGEESVAPFQPPKDGSDGYVASKWAAEVFLEKASGRLGLPVCIYRPSNITGDDTPELDIIQNVIRYSRNLAAVPDLRGWLGYFDFIAVEKVAAGVVRNVKNETRRKNIASFGRVDYINASGELVVPIPEVQQHLERELKRPVRQLSMDQWVKESSAMGLHALVAGFLSSIANAGDVTEIRLPKLISRWA